MMRFTGVLTGSSHREDLLAHRPAGLSRDLSALAEWLGTGDPPPYVRGHLFACFLALYVAVLLRRRLADADLRLPWDGVIRDLSQLRAVTVRLAGERYRMRTPLRGHAGKVFDAVGVKLPPLAQALEASLRPPRGLGCGGKDRSRRRNPLLSNILWIGTVEDGSDLTIWARRRPCPACLSLHSLADRIRLARNCAAARISGKCLPEPGPANPARQDMEVPE